MDGAQPRMDAELSLANVSNVDEAAAALCSHLVSVGYPGLELGSSMPEHVSAVINCIGSLCRAREDGRAQCERADHLFALASQRERDLQSAEAALRHAQLSEHSRSVNFVSCGSARYSCT